MDASLAQTERGLLEKPPFKLTMAPSDSPRHLTGVPMWELWRRIHDPRNADFSPIIKERILLLAI